MLTQKRINEIDSDYFKTITALTHKEYKIEKEKALDGCYVIKSNTEILDNNEIIETYRGLQKVEQAFKNMKTIMLELRPIYHKSDERIMAHIFIVMLAYYLQWHIT